MNHEIRTIPNHPAPTLLAQDFSRDEQMLLKEGHSYAGKIPLCYLMEFVITPDGGERTYRFTLRAATDTLDEIIVNQHAPIRFPRFCPVYLDSLHLKVTVSLSRSFLHFWRTERIQEAWNTQPFLLAPELDLLHGQTPVDTWHGCTMSAPTNSPSLGPDISHLPPPSPLPTFPSPQQPPNVPAALCVLQTVPTPVHGDDEG